jgi:DNA-binding MarR family transcriptional regulator
MPFYERGEIFMEVLNRKEKVLKCLIEIENDRKRGITAVELSSYMGLERANISRYLNELYKENRINKKEGRPVIYSSLKHEKEYSRQKLQYYIHLGDYILLYWVKLVWENHCLLRLCISLLKNQI